MISRSLSSQPQIVRHACTSHIERMLASCLYWKGMQLRNTARWPSLEKWLDAFEKRQIYQVSVLLLLPASPLTPVLLTIILIHREEVRFGVLAVLLVVVMMAEIVRGAAAAAGREHDGGDDG